MRRAILFLVFALFLAMVIQPNLNKQIKEKSKSMFPNKQNRPLLPMIRFQIRVVNQKQSFVLMQVMEEVIVDILVMGIPVKKI